MSEQTPEIALDEALRFLSKLSDDSLEQLRRLMQVRAEEKRIRHSLARRLRPQEAKVQRDLRLIVS